MSKYRGRLGSLTLEGQLVSEKENSEFKLVLNLERDVLKMHYMRSASTSAPRSKLGYETSKELNCDGVISKDQIHL